MSLEGRLRELNLAEVLQLLGVSRKSGTLSLRAALEGRQATIVLDSGWVVGCTEQSLFDDQNDSGVGSTERPLSERVLDLLQWVEGDFRFDQHEVRGNSVSQRVPVELLLMESARRADAWSTIGDLVRGPRAVPSFPDVQPRQLSLLHLIPDQWEILTRVDGTSTIEELARSLGHDLVDVATRIHELIVAGVLVLRDSEEERRSVSIPTPLTSTAIPPVYSPDMPFAPPFEAGDDDSLFDPMQLGVMTPDGMPAVSGRSRKEVAVVSSPAASVISGVASRAARESLQESNAQAATGAEPAHLLRAGDEAAGCGDLVAAAELWSQWLAVHASAPEATQVHERIALARRLHALLHS